MIFRRYFDNSWLRVRAVIFALYLVLSIADARSEVRMPAIFGDHMVLQEDARLPIWGWAAPGEKITVTFEGKRARTETTQEGKWRVDLKPVAPNGQGGVLIVSGRNRLIFNDVLVGDVWIASGQSNMEFGIQMDSRGEDATSHANDTQIRLFLVPKHLAFEPSTDIVQNPASPLSGKWQICSPEVLAANWGWNGFSAVAYYFARELRHKTGHPIGMIGSYVGATPAQAWTSIDALRREPILAHYVTLHQQLVENYPKAKTEYPEELREYQKSLKSWDADFGTAYSNSLAKWARSAAQAAQANKDIPPRPQTPPGRPHEPLSPEGGNTAPANLFNGMIAPLIPYAIKGAIWYQGEGNGVSMRDAVEYGTLFPRMIMDWRARWGEGNFPFLFVQLANCIRPGTQLTIWPWLREAQSKTLSLPETGMAAAIDIGNPFDIHPKDKFDVGLRLALVAEHVAYGEDVLYSGPIYDSMEVDGHQIRLHFRSRGKALTIGLPPWTPTGEFEQISPELIGFQVAGNDEKFVQAQAILDGDTIVVSSDKVSQPVAVRYDWEDAPKGNLYGLEGLPALPFRTDDWAPPSGPP